MVSSMALSSAIKFISLAVHASLLDNSLHLEGIHLLIVDDRRGAHKFIDFGIALPSQLRDIRFCLVNG